MKEFEKKDENHKILVCKINQLYKEGMDQKALYDTVRGIWSVSKESVKDVDYVFGVYQSVIIAVYKPTKWFVYGDAKGTKDEIKREDINKKDSKNDNKLFFIDERCEEGDFNQKDANEQFYIGKYISNLKGQNPIKYL